MNDIKPDIFEATYERPDQPTEPARCAPSREALADALKAHDFSRMTCLDHSHYGVSCDEFCHGVTDNQYLHHSDAIQSLYANQRTEAEVKAEAWEEAATWFDADLCGVSLIIRDRANRLSATQPTPVFEAMGLPTPEVPNVERCTYCGSPDDLSRGGAVLACADCLSQHDGGGSDA